MRKLLYSLTGVICTISLYLMVNANSATKLESHLFGSLLTAITSRADYSDFGELAGIKPVPPSPSSQCLTEASASFAKSAPLIWFDPTLKGGAHTWVFNGAEVIKGLTAYCGDSRLSAELLAQIRIVLRPEKGPTATGGFQDQKQLGTAFMFLLAKRTPPIWSRLSQAEQALIDLSMEALMYSSTFTTKDQVATALGMNGDTNLARDWAPNFQNGMVGMIIVTALYWGFDQFEAKLASYDDAAFLQRLRANHMQNLLSTYANPARPSGATVEAGLRKVVNGAIYRFHDITERNLLGLFAYIARRTFSATVSCGVNDGSGIGGYGRIAKNCDKLPNLGRKGMMLEFDYWDAEGKRSSAAYNFDAWYPLNYSRAALQIEGWLTQATVKQSETLSEAMDRYRIGSNDLWFKISPNEGGGYLDYEHGEPGDVIVLDPAFVSRMGAYANLDLFNMLQRNLGMAEINR
jgi:hypothetical protein